MISAESWTDGQIVCPVDGLSNGTHVAKITNSDTAISRILFSITEDPSSQSLYEHSHSLPLSVPEFESDWIDTFSFHSGSASVRSVDI